MTKRMPAKRINPLEETKERGLDRLSKRNGKSKYSVLDPLAIGAKDSVLYGKNRNLWERLKSLKN